MFKPRKLSRPPSCLTLGPTADGTAASRGGSLSSLRVPPPEIRGAGLQASDPRADAVCPSLFPTAVSPGPRLEALRAESCLSLLPNTFFFVDFRSLFFIFILTSSTWPDIFLQSRTSRNSTQKSSSVNPDQYLSIQQSLRESQ